MKFRRIGDTDLDCSIIGLGTGRLASVSGGVSPAAAARLLGVAEERGINLIDTADSYAQGECEKIIGRVLQSKRDKFIVATKAGYCFSTLTGVVRFIKPLAKQVLKKFKGGRSLAGSVRTNISRQEFASAAIRSCVESSLQRLRTDYLDIFLLHTPPLATMADGELFELLRRLKREGKIRHFGVSSHDSAVLERALQVAGLSVVQTPVNPALPAANGMLPKMQSAKIGVVANQIFLSGKLAESAAPSGGGGNEISALKARLMDLANRKGISLHHLLIKHALGQSGIVSVLTGTTNPEHLRQNVADALSATELSAEELAQIAAGENAGAAR